MKFRNLGKRIVEGSVKAGKATASGVDKLSAWQEKQQTKSIAKKQRHLKAATLDAKIAKQKAIKKKYQPKDMFDDDWSI